MNIRAASLAFLATLAIFAQGSGGLVYNLAKEGHTSDEHWGQHSALIGKPMPKLKLGAWMNGKVNPKDMEGKIVIVDFWATWCGPCIRAIPHNNEIARKYADKGVVLIGICASGEENMADAVKRGNIKYPVARTTPSTTDAWKVAYYPTYGVVDKNGVVRALGVGASYVEKIVDALLKE